MFDAKKLYDDIGSIFEASDQEVIDIQSDFMERLEIVSVVAGDKPSFYDFCERPGRAELFQEISARLQVEGVTCGFNQVDVHHRYRPLKLAYLEHAKLVETRSAEKFSIFWFTKDSALAGIYRNGEVYRHTDTKMLAYPSCCSAWHFDAFFARPMEAFCDVYLKQEAPMAIASFLETWNSSPGWFLPRSFFTAALFRSNFKFPFVPHFACPRCIADPESTTAQQNAQFSALGQALDPVRHAQVIDWTRGLDRRVRDIVDHWRDEVAIEARDLGLNTLASEAVARHSRYLLGSLGLSR